MAWIFILRGLSLLSIGKHSRSNSLSLSLSTFMHTHVLEFVTFHACAKGTKDMKQCTLIFF